MIVRATEPHSVEIDGVSWTIARGKKLPASHPAAKRNPELFEATEGGWATPLEPDRLDNLPKDSSVTNCETKTRH